MLAGRMKLNHFLIIVFVVVAGGVTALVLTREPTPVVAVPKAKMGPAPRPGEARSPSPRPGPAPAAAPAGDGPSEREVDVAVMQWRGKNLGSDKKKDVSKGKSFKINVYQDAGKDSCNRAKVDLDRDDKFDEKWTFDGDSISRQVAPADDENYSEQFVWDGKGWAKP